VSTIWSGDIKGNSSTKWMKAPASFNYNTATDVSTIRAAFDSTVATLGVDSVEEGKVYLARIRNSNLYVAMRTYNIHNATAPGGIKDVYFDFDYKYGTYVAAPPPTSIKGVRKGTALVLYPNPADNNIAVKNPLSTALKARIISAGGREVFSVTLPGNATTPLDISALASGSYFLSCEATDGVTENYSFIRR